MIHVGDGVTVDLVGVVECVAEGDEGGEETVDGPETAQPVGETVGLRRGECHAGAGSSGLLIDPSYHRRRDERSFVKSFVLPDGPAARGAVTS